MIQTPSVQIEILPKVDFGDSSVRIDNCRRNLLVMMAVARRLPVRERELAALSTQNAPVLEALVGMFAESLLAELRRGLDRSYIAREANLGFVRGKLVMPTHLRVNLAHRERVYVEFDELLEDTWLNRVLKAACRRLVRTVARLDVQRNLREAILMFADVRDVFVRREDLKRVGLTRLNRRFERQLRFAELVLLGRSPAPHAGTNPSFSVLVPMDILFEEFVGETIRRNARKLGFEPANVLLQARGRRSHLVRRVDDGRPLYRLKPDVLVDGPEGGFRCVLDTKWKRLDRRTSKRPSNADMYQLNAYARHFRAPLSVLLYPKLPGLSNQDFTIEADETRRIRVAFVDVNRDLRADLGAFIASLRAAIEPD